jgi:hypothetical protein
VSLTATYAQEIKSSREGLATKNAEIAKGERVAVLAPWRETDRSFTPRRDGRNGEAEVSHGATESMEVCKMNLLPLP